MHAQALHGLGDGFAELRGCFGARPGNALGLFLASLERMTGAGLLIIDGLRYDLHPTHMCLDESLAAIRAIEPGQAFLTHLSHNMDYRILSGRLPENVGAAYDGLRLSLP